MKSKHNLGSIALVVLAALLGCKDDAEETGLMPQHLNGIVRLEASTSNKSGIWEGDGMNYTENFSIDIQHSDNTDEVMQTQVVISNDHNAEYTFIVGKRLSARDSTNELVKVEYEVKATGGHHLDFYYQEQDKDRVHLGAYEFTVNN